MARGRTRGKASSDVLSGALRSLLSLSMLCTFGISMFTVKLVFVVIDNFPKVSNHRNFSLESLRRRQYWKGIEKNNKAIWQTMLYRVEKQGAIEIWETAAHTERPRNGGREREKGCGIEVERRRAVKVFSGLRYFATNDTITRKAESSIGRLSQHSRQEKCNELKPY